MEKIIIPTVSVLATGTDFAAKQMQANANEVMPLHHANLESILFIYEGECILQMNDEELLLNRGKPGVIHPLINNKFKELRDYKGIHLRPKAIKLEFLKI